MGWPPATASCCAYIAATPSSPPPSIRCLLLPRRREPPQKQRTSVAMLLSDRAGDQPRRLLFDYATSNNAKNAYRTSSRRSLLLMLFPFAVPLPALSSAAAAADPLMDTPPAREEDNLERYTDPAEGFTLLKPSSWLKVEKAGATALFEEEGKGSNNIGVVVNPVRLSSLQEFGTPQFVADKLIQAERRKESTQDAEVIAAAERLGHTGLPIYEFEYTVDSTRGGMKRIFSAAFVASKKLYLLNVAYSDRPDNPLDSRTRILLEQVLHSFDTAS